MNYSNISAKLNIPEKNVKSVLNLLSDGATIPFISRYRKDSTGGLDEIQIEQIRKEQDVLQKLEDRRKFVLETITELNAPEEVLTKIEKASSITEIEDLYLPFKRKKTSKAEKAKNAGLLGLAKLIMAQRSYDIERDSQQFIKNGISSVEEALSGARDIISEWVTENEIVRNKIRKAFQRSAQISSKVVAKKKDEAEKYQDYFDYSEHWKKCSAHRYLAVIRGENEKLLKVKVQINEDEIFDFLERFYIKNDIDLAQEIRKSYKNAFKKYIAPAMEVEIRNLLKEQSDNKSIDIFSKNLQQLLLEAPLGNKRVLAIDPGFKSGCKVVCLDEHGDLLHNVNIYPHAPQNESTKAKNKLFQLIQTYKIEAIAIGDGTAGRETERLIKHMKFNQDLMVFVVREDGASVYSASSIARAEFPKFDVTVRGAVSIGRRLMDPLAELVKIDPKSLGIGQYQHDVDQKLLKSSLDRVIQSVVNKVGVELNTASEYLLAHISGLGPQLAKNIVEYRSENGGFRSRSELKKVPRLGDKAFEQAAGFLRISNSKNPLDNSSVHPENYAVVKKMASSVGTSIEDLIGDHNQVKEIKRTDFSNIGEFAWKDLVKELQKPTRDPREKVKAFEFRSDIHTINDLIVGMRLPGMITNITDFGAFVNIGIKENGLIHKSQIQDEYVESPSDHLSLGQQLEVKVQTVDQDRKRIGLTLKF